MGRMSQRTRQFNRNVSQTPVHLISSQNKTDRHTSTVAFNRRTTLSEYTETARLEKLKHQNRQKKQPKVVILQLPKRAEAAPVLPSPALTEQHKTSTPLMEWLNKNIVYPVLSAAAGLVILITLGTVRPDFAKAAPKPKPVPGVMEDGKKENRAPAIYGQGKYFDDLKFNKTTGELEITGLRPEGGTPKLKVSIIGVRGMAEELSNRYGRKFSCEGEPFALATATLEDSTSGVKLPTVYLVYGDAVFRIVKNVSNGETFVKAVWLPDSSVIEDVVHTKYGFVATTKTGIIRWTHVDPCEFFYKDIFTEFPKSLADPKLSSVGEYVVLQDPTFYTVSDKKRWKCLIPLTKEVRETARFVPEEQIVVSSLVK